jgi:hypothetical protein
MEEVFVVEEGEVDRRFFCVLGLLVSITGGAPSSSFPVTASVTAKGLASGVSFIVSPHRELNVFEATKLKAL